MARAFTITSQHKMYFESAEGQYRYWYTPGKHLKLQIPKKALESFRKSLVGKRIESYVDIFQIGGGWYEITVRDWATPRFGGPRFLLELSSQGLQLWIKAFNLAHVAQVNENHYRFSTQYVGRAQQPTTVQRPPSNQQLSALAAKFAKV